MVISKSLKKQNKFALAEEIGWGNDIFFSKIGWGNELRQKKLNICKGKLFENNNTKKVFFKYVWILPL